jgi:uncharacterized protein YfaS (alpha-2-macroglobulin family)
VVAGDDDLTATTLLVVSDVEAVVKSAAGRQVFVWARDRATGAPVEGARVLATDGTAVFAEGVTAGRRLPPRHRPHGPARPRAEGRPPAATE